MKRVFFREDGWVTTDSDIELDGKVDHSVIGWVSIKLNPQGWCIYPLSQEDITWFNQQGQSTENAFRIISMKGNTTLVKIKLETGMISFFDNAKYMHDDEIKWERFFPYTEVHIDDNDESKDQFGVSK